MYAIDDKDKTSSLAYRIGQGIAVVLSICLAAILIALTIRFIMWLF